MIEPKRKLLPLCLLAGLALLVPACSDDDDPTDPENGGGDTTAPQVTGIDPDDGQVMVDTSPLIVITFSEPMDPDSADGEVTLAPSVAVATSWVDDRNLMVQPDPLAQASSYTVTVGTGLADAAGNNLAKQVTSSFWTYADVVTVMDFDPPNLATDVNRSASINLLFSEPMNTSSIETGITITDGTKANHPFTVESQDNVRYQLNPLEPLNANTLTTVTMTTAVQTQGGDFFPEAISISFTTNDVVDNTPPTIVSMDPPSGSTIQPDLAEITIEFSEPMDTDNLSPTMMNGQFAWVINRITEEISWSPDKTTITVPMPGDLPAGLPLEVRFAGYSDANGNVQPEETTWTVTVDGTADPYPVANGMRWTMMGTWSEGEAGSEEPTFSSDGMIYFEYTSRGAADQWNKREFYDPEYMYLDTYEIQSVTAAAVTLVGFEESNEGEGKKRVEYFLSNPLTFLDLPLGVGNTWSSSATVALPDGTIGAEANGEVIAKSDLTMPDTGPEFEITWTDVWVVELVLDLTFDGEDMSQETIQYWIAPGIGIVRDMYRENRLDPQNPGWEARDFWYYLNLD